MTSAKRFVLTTFFDGKPEEGGGYTQKRRLLDVLRQLQSDQLQVVVIASSREGASTARELGLTGVFLPRSRIRIGICRLLAQNFWKRAFGAWLPKLSFVLDAQLRRLGTNLVLFTGPDSRALELLEHNFIASVWDLCHLDHPEFPEVSHRGEFERREYLYGNTLRKAVAVLVDSQYGRHLVQQRYSVAIERCYAVPFLTYDTYRDFKPNESESQRIAQHYRLKQPYIFYPAQFWPHKNHKYILEALHIAKRDFGWAPQAVFSGSDKGALDTVMARARELGVAEHLNYCGFVPDPHMPYLYSGALALVMPTYFGPTNIPPMEALALGVPVCYSDFPSFREQLGERAVYMDLTRPESLATALNSLHQESTRRPGTRIPQPAMLTADHEYLRVLEQIVGAYRAKTQAGIDLSSAPYQDARRPENERPRASSAGDR